MDRVNRRRRRATRTGAFTLIEVMVALSILAVGLLTVAGAQIQAMKGGSTGRHTSDAAAIAHSQIENFQRIDWADAAMNATGGWAPVAGVQVDSQVQSDVGTLTEQSYSVQWRIVDVNPQLKTIEVRVTWNEPERPNRSVTISTMRHNDPETSS